MTQATPETAERHDTLTGVTGKSGRGTARQTIRVDEALWESFGTAAGSLELDRSAVLRDFMRWYAREPGAKLPRRPDAQDQREQSGNKPG
jgi:hypothetical protein